MNIKIVHETFTAMVNSLKNNEGIEEHTLDEFFLLFERDYRVCKRVLSKKLATFLENNHFLHDAEIIEVSIRRYMSGKKYVNDVTLQILPCCSKKVYRLTFKQASKFHMENFIEHNTDLTWGYGYFSLVEDNRIEVGAICFPGMLIQIKCKKILL